MAFTYFWRDLHSLKALLRQMRPRLPKDGQVRVWDAGCAMGQEPYTLIMLMHEMWPEDVTRRVKVWATDYEPDFEKHVREATYPNDQLKRVPEKVLGKYFDTIDEERKQVTDIIRRRLVFQTHDLVTLRPVAHSFNAILCKNVLLHLLPAQRVKVLQMFHEALAPQGLFVTEQTQKIPSEAKPLFRQLSTDAQMHEKK